MGPTRPRWRRRRRRHRPSTSTPTRRHHPGHDGHLHRRLDAGRDVASSGRSGPARAAAPTPNPTHTYNTPGTYTVALKVTYPTPTGAVTTTKVGYITRRRPGRASCPSLDGVQFNSAEAIWQGAPYNFTGIVIRGTGRAQRQLHDHRPGPHRRLADPVQQRHHGEPAMSLRPPARNASSRRTRGQALVEFALVIPIFLLHAGRPVRPRSGGLRLQHADQCRPRGRPAGDRQPGHRQHHRAREEPDGDRRARRPERQVDFWQMARRRRRRTTTDPCNLVAVGCLAVVRSRRPTGRSRRSSATSCSGTA